MANAFTNYKSVLTTNALTTLYTVGSETTAIIKSVRVSNVDTENDCKVSLFIVDTDGNSFNVETDRTIKSKRSAELLATGVTNSGFGSTDSSFAPATPMVAKESEAIKIQAENGGDLNVILSVMEIS
jgi:hypothetical protein